jgi:hypothetical protein
MKRIVLTTDVFLAWLDAQPEDVIGFADGGCDCPVARCLGSLYPGEWNVGYDVARDYHEPDASADIEKPIANFIHKMMNDAEKRLDVDGPRPPVTRERALWLWTRANMA